MPTSYTPADLDFSNTHIVRDESSMRDRISVDGKVFGLDITWADLNNEFVAVIVEALKKRAA